MGLTHTRMRLALVHEKLVTCTKQTPETFHALSTVYPMNSGVEKEPREEEKKLSVETNSNRKPSGREEHHSMVAFLSIFTKLPLTPRMNGYIAT